MNEGRRWVAVAMSNRMFHQLALKIMYENPFCSLANVHLCVQCAYRKQITRIDECLCESHISVIEHILIFFWSLYCWTIAQSQAAKATKKMIPYSKFGALLWVYNILHD